MHYKQNNSLKLQLKNKLRMVPTKLQKAEKDLKEFEEKYDKMMQLKPIKENVSDETKTIQGNCKC